MKYKLKIINTKMGKDVYEMYQDIPKEEKGEYNAINGLSYAEYKKQLKQYKKDEVKKNISLDTTTNRYIFYNEDYPIGEAGIRTTINDYWKNKGSQIFYKIRVSERNKGYGTIMLKLALDNCRKLGMKVVRINCDDTNTASKRIIEKNGGILDIESYKTKTGLSSSYIINL
jgi:predicted acetyltransferase